MNKLLSSLLILTPFLSGNTYAVEEADPALAEIVNFRQYSPTFASAGQPSREQFATIAEHGFERIVYIAFTNNQNALTDADQVIKGLGMEYMQVPVDLITPCLRIFMHLPIPCNEILTRRRYCIVRSMREPRHLASSIV